MGKNNQKRKLEARDIENDKMIKMIKKKNQDEDKWTKEVVGV